MYYNFNPITMSITSITVAITSIKCITVSILYQCPSPSPSRLSHALHLHSYNNVSHHRHHVCHMQYRLIPKQCPSPSPSCLSHALQLKSYNNLHHHGNHVYHMPYSFNPIIMSITIALTSITCITASIL